MIFKDHRTLSAYHYLLLTVYYKADMSNQSGGQLKPRSILRGKWQIVEKIGNGGFGEIYKAKDLENNEVSKLKYAANSNTPIIVTDLNLYIS